MKLSFKLLIPLIAGTAVVVLLVSLLSYNYTRSVLRKTVSANQLGIARQTMEQIDGLLYERYNDIQQAAGEDLFQDALKGQTKNNPSALRRIRELTITSGPWDSLFAVDRKGNIVLSSIEEEIGKPVGLEPHSLPAYEEAMKGKIYHSDQVISDDTGKPTIIFSAPVRDKEDPKQAVIGTAIGHFAWPAVEEILDNMPSPSRKAHAMVVNNEGTVIACSMPDPDMVGMNMEKSSFVREVLAGRAGSAVLPANEGMLGVSSLVAYAPQEGRLSYKPNGWGLILETPLEEALADASKTAFRLVLFLMPVLLAMGGLAVWLNVKLVLKPVSLLTKTAEAIRRGDISQRAVPLSQDEIGELANTFNQMIENLSSEKKYRAFTDSAPNAIVSMDEAGCIISWNLRAEKMFGYQKDEALGKPMTLIMPERFREAHLAGLKRYRKIRESNVIGKTVELAGLKKTGEEFPVELVISSWNQESELFFTGIIHDTTERKKAEKERERLEAQLLQAQKMESIGRLTGGVAHDFNNLLGIIIGNCELAQNEAKPDGPVGEYLKDIKEAGDRAAQLTRQLLAFSRKQVLKPALLNLNDTLEETDRLFQRLIGENIQLLTVPAPDLGLVKADPNQIEQIIFNLASNARDAMPYGGKLTLETQNVVLDEQYAVHHPEVKPGPYVMMAVSDNGLGMDAKILSQIFEPFFTTKEK
ncbi:MAG: PAS domain S-box protein, partial [Deltaproteobacteria bacterium]|nr:PAS domain S-box protein [Deltaproteobacteria bacterium]